MLQRIMGHTVPLETSEVWQEVERKPMPGPAFEVDRFDGTNSVPTSWPEHHREGPFALRNFSQAVFVLHIVHGHKPYVH